jgi:hypothetical protein
MSQRFGIFEAKEFCENHEDQRVRSLWKWLCHCRAKNAQWCEALANCEGEPHAFRAAWPEGLEAMKSYGVECDDEGMRCDANMSVMVDEQGDVYVSMHAYHDEDRTVRNLNPFPTIRIRTGIGGGRNRRTRQALLWLAKAMELDAESDRGILG